MRILAALTLAAVLLYVAYADDAPPQGAALPDPMVALDEAKMTLADGRLEDARKQLAGVPADPAEPAVEEETVFQRMLLDAAFLDASDQLYTELRSMHVSGAKYQAWLWTQVNEHAANFADDVQQYLELTQDGYALDFVRFRLPVVTEQHISDVGLYSDKQILAAAAASWETGGDALGHGLITIQARVAVTLAAARYYDLPESGEITQVAGRLTAGVPIYPALTLDWIAEVCGRHPVAGHGLTQLGKDADARLAQLLAKQPDARIAQRIQVRAAPPVVVQTKEPVKPSKKPVHKRKRRRR